MTNSVSASVSLTSANHSIKLDLLNAVEHQMFIKSEKHFYKKLRKLAEKNFNYVSSLKENLLKLDLNLYSSTVFSYKGTMYPFPTKNHYTFSLHESLYLEADKIIIPFNQHTKSKKRIMYSMRQLLTSCNTVADLIFLLPADILQLVPAFRDIKNIKLNKETMQYITIPPDMLELLKKSNEKAIKEVKAYFFQQTIFNSD